MNYTMLTCQDLATGQVLDIVKNGNVYNVEFTDKETFITIGFKTLNEAKERYLKIIDCFITGYYNFGQRVEILRGERNEKM